MSATSQAIIEEQILDYDENEINFSFKQMRKVALGDELSQYNFRKGDKLSLICSSKQYGLVFIAKLNGFIVFPAYTLTKCHEANYTLPLGHIIPAADSGIHSKFYDIGASPFFLSLNAENSVLICLLRNPQNAITAAFYDVTSFSPDSPVSNPNAIFPLTNDPNLLLTELQWNPTRNDLFSVCFSNGQTHLVQFKLPQSMRLLKMISDKATSLCWSPKGKHIAIGTNEGTLKQYSCEDDNIRLVKQHPKISNIASLETKVVHLKWLSSFLFAMVYSLQNDSGETEQILVLKHSKKGEQTVIMNFNDLYVQSENSPTFYFTEHFIQQQVLLTTTGLSSEIFVLANQGNPANPADWFYSSLDDTSRAELPLEGTEDTYPMGIAFDMTSQFMIPTEKHPIPPQPILLLLTTKGILCPFHIIYEGMANLVEPPRQLKSSKHAFNPQAVTKNLSTTTVTVTGGNKPITAQSTTFTLPQPQQTHIITNPLTEPRPSQPKVESQINPMTSLPITKVIQNVSPPVTLPAPPPAQHFTIPKLPGNAGKTPPTTLPIQPASKSSPEATRSAPVTGPSSIAQPAIFQISKNIQQPSATTASRPADKQQQQQQQLQPQQQLLQPQQQLLQPQQQLLQPQQQLLQPQQPPQQQLQQKPQQTTNISQTTSQVSSSVIQIPKQPASTILQKQVVFSSTAQSTVNTPTQVISQNPSTIVHPQAKTAPIPALPLVTPQTQQVVIPLTVPAPSPLEIEVKYEIHIRNEIEDFSEDLEVLKSKLRTKFGNFDDTFQSKLKDMVGSDAEKNKMYRDTTKVQQELDQAIKNCEEMNQIISTIRNEGFHIQEKIEDANKAKKWISSAKFGAFIAATPLDPISEEKKKMLIHTYSILDQRLQEVEISLEDLLVRSSDSNDFQAISKTIISQEEILQNLHSKLNELSEQVETVKVNRQLSKISLSSSRIHPFELLNESLEKQHFNFKVKPNRIRELKEFLCQTSSARVIKPRNPTNTLNISRAIKPQKSIELSVNSKPPQPPNISPIQSNTGFKLLLSPQGEIFVSPNPQSLPDGCVSMDASHLQNITQASIRKQSGNSPLKSNIPSHIPANITNSNFGLSALPKFEVPQILSNTSNNEPGRSTIPKYVVEHKPDEISAQQKQVQQQQQQQQLNPSKEQRVNRILDFSTPPKAGTTTDPSDSLTSTPVKPLDTTPEMPAPNVNPFSDPTFPLFGQGRLGTPPEYSGSTMHSSQDPRLKQNIKSTQKSSSDLQLSSLLSSGEPANPVSTPQDVGKDPNKAVNSLSTSKPPSKLLQSTNAETKSSPTEAQQNSSSLDESQTINIVKKNEKIPTNSDTNPTKQLPTVKPHVSESIGQSVNPALNLNVALDTKPSNTGIPISKVQSGIENEQNKVKTDPTSKVNLPVVGDKNSANTLQASIPPPQVSQTLFPQQSHRLSSGGGTLSTISQPSIADDSEMQDDNDDVSQTAGLGLHSISLGGMGGKLAPPTFNPFGNVTHVATGSASSISFSGVSAGQLQQPSLNTQPKSQPQAQTNNIPFAQSQPNFGGTSSLFQGRSLLQGIGGSNQPQILFGQNSSAPTFGSIANQTAQQPSSFGMLSRPIGQTGSFSQPANPMPFGQTQNLFGGNSGFGSSSQRGPQGFGSSGTIVPKGSEIKGNAFTSYRT